MADEALLKKVRLTGVMKAAVLQAPSPDYIELLGLDAGSSAEAAASADESCDFVMLFAKDIASLDGCVEAAVRAVKREGLLWVCYPKGSSKLKTDLNRDRGWEGLGRLGWEGIGLVSLDDTWSAMRFRPKELSNRGGAARARAAAAASDGGVSVDSAAELATPDDLAAALAVVPEAEQFFAKLAPSHRKEYIRWIVEAKREETRQKRVTAAVEKLSASLKRPSDKV